MRFENALKVSPLKASPDNYRGMTILSCFGKLFTAVLNNRLNTYLENMNVLQVFESIIVPLIPFSTRNVSLIFICSEAVLLFLFGFNITFNNFSVISRRCLVAIGSSVLTFIVLPH